MGINLNPLAPRTEALAVARSRNLKPGYFTNELLGAGDPLAQLLYAGLWCLADASGTLEDRPARIKAEIFPHRPADVDVLLGQLAAQGFVVRYAAAGLRLLHLPTFLEHQKPHYSEKPKGFPLPTELQVHTNPENSGEIRPLTDSLFPLPSSLNPSTPLPPSSGGSLSAADFLTAWNQVPTFVHARGLAGARGRHFQARAREADWLQHWQEALGRASRCPFCGGANDRGWRATVDWFLRPDTVTKILEGVYDRLGRGPPPRPAESPEACACRREQERARAEAERRLAEAERAATRQLIEQARGQSLFRRNGPQGKRDA